MPKENFDASVKRILEQTEFAYDPAAWDQAQRLLAAERNRRLGGWWWTLLLLAVSTLVGAGISGLQELGPPTILTTAPAVTTSQQSSASSKNIPLEAPTSHAESKLYVIYQADSSQPAKKSPVRLINQARENHPSSSLADSIRPEINTFEFIYSRPGKLISRLNSPLPFTASQREVPAFDFKYDTRPTKQARQSSLAAFAWAGQQGRNSENNVLQQQYGLGMNWQWEMRPGLSLQLGAALGYNIGFSYSRQKSDTTYGFGRTITTQTTNVGNYWQFQLPVGLVYRIAPKHQLELGAAYHSYLGSHYQLQTTMIGEDMINSSNEQLRGKISGIGLSPWSWHTGYRYTFNEAFALGLRYQQQSRPGMFFPAEKSFRFVLHYHFYRFSL